MTNRGPAGIRFPFPAPPDCGQITEIARDLYWTRLPLPMKPDHLNVYVARDDDGWTIIDTGLNTARCRAIWSDLLDGPLDGAPVVRVILTHHHPDHVGLAGWFRSVHGAALSATRTAWLFARMLQLDDQELPTPETLTFWRRAGMDPGRIERRARERPFNFADVVAPIPLGFTRMDRDAVLDFSGRSWRVRLGQGHAPDHATLFSADRALVLGGDQFLPTISPNLGVYATEPEANPVADWLESLTALGRHADDSALVLPGHGLPYRGLATRIAQLRENHLSALDRLQAALSEPMSAAETFPVLYRREIREGEYVLALVEAMAHCLALWHAGRATRALSEEGAWMWTARTT